MKKKQHKLAYRVIHYLTKACIASTFCFVFIAVIDSSPRTAIVPARSPQAAEIYTATTDLTIYNQGMASLVTVSLDYALIEGTNSPSKEVLINNLIGQINKHSHRNEYWEVLNASISRELMQQYPQISHLNLSLTIGPRTTIPYTCISTVTHWADGRTQEGWSFSLPDLSLGKIETTAYISYVYREDALYPDFLEVRDRFIEYLNESGIQDLPLDQISMMLTQELSQYYSRDLAEVTIEFY